eukprot:2832702-Prymnesium_polylepis.2
MQRHKIATHALWNHLPPAHQPNTVPVSFVHFESEEEETAEQGVKVEVAAANEQSDDADEQEADASL